MTSEPTVQHPDWTALVLVLFHRFEARHTLRLAARFVVLFADVAPLPLRFDVPSTPARAGFVAAVGSDSPCMFPSNSRNDCSMPRFATSR
jgi:hypothetical protein